jgi:hypothetical protein
MRSLHSDVAERCCLLYASAVMISVQGKCLWWQAHVSWTVHTTPVWWRVALSLEHARQLRAHRGLMRGHPKTEGRLRCPLTRETSRKTAIGAQDLGVDPAAFRPGQE